jgi:hypothetical protein
VAAIVNAAVMTAIAIAAITAIPNNNGTTIYPSMISTGMT